MRKKPVPAPLPAPLVFLAALCAALCGMLAGCARVADPRPPEVRVPEAVRDLSARQEAGAVVLRLSLPEKNADGTAASDVRALEVFRLTEPVEEGSPDGGGAPPAPLQEDDFLKRAAHILSIPAARFPEHLRDGRLAIRDEAPPSGRLRYAAVFVDGKRRAAGLGNQAAIRLVPPLPVPQGLAATVAEDGIVLEWTLPAGGPDGADGAAVGVGAAVAGYNVYRSESPGVFPSTPLNAAPLAAARYLDGDFQFGRDYYYSVSAVGGADAGREGGAAPPAESGRSDEVAVTARDVFPPAPPGEFTAVAGDGGVTFFWTPSPSPDVAGYRIFRKGGGGREPVQPGLAVGVSLRVEGADAASGGAGYEIEAVDGHGNASAPVDAEVPGGPAY